MRRQQDEDGAARVVRDQIHRALNDFSRIEGTSVHGDEVMRFLDQVRDLVEDNARRKYASGQRANAFENLRGKYGLSVADAEGFARLLTIVDDRTWKAVGREMLFILSENGHIQATLYLLNVALAEHRRRGTLQKATMLPVRQRLTQLANEGSDYRAMILEGKIVYTLGNVDRAISLWTKAMDEAIAQSDELRRSGGWAERVAENQAKGIDGLDAPWVELAGAYLSMKDVKNAEKVNAIGCDQDDVHSHYLAALIIKQKYPPDYITSGWLYHMTKAAATCHVKAAHELGIYYGTSTWKYIDEEPPDRVKPTPFDSYPAPGMSFAERLRIATGLTPIRPVAGPETMFHTATFPATAEGRMLLALEWLTVGTQMSYAPSYLAAAEFYLQKNLHPEDTAPKTALQLADSRYKYASEADYLAVRPIIKEDDSHSEDKPDKPEKPKSDEQHELLNPYYDPERAKDNIRQLLYAIQAAEVSHRIQKHLTTLRKSGKTRSDELEPDNHLRESDIAHHFTEHIGKWFRFTEIREMYTDDDNNICFDDAQRDRNLAEIAMDICDEQKWDIYGFEGALMYKHGLSPRRVLPAVGRGDVPRK